jgi:hypothetical protein
MSFFSAIGDFVSGAFDTVTNWVTGAAGGVVQAVAGAALKGAVYGAVIGAAQSAITGGDIKKGALRGTAIGGIATGITYSLMQISGMNDAVSAGTDSRNRVSDSIGAMPQDELIAKATGYVAPTKSPGLLADLYSGAEKTVKKVGSTTGRWWDKFSDDEKGRVLGGLAQGAATSAGNYFAAEQKAESDKELLQYKTQIDQDKIKANQPSSGFQQRTARINIKNRWEKWVA